MSVYISKKEIASFKGDVLPLYLTDGEKIVRSAKSSVDGEAVIIKEYDSGALVTLLKEGVATINATLDGKEYSCTVTVEPSVSVNDTDTLSFFRADS